MSTIRLEHVSVFHRDVRSKTAVAALFDVSLEIADGLMTVVQGPSGCGKTTLLKVISGVLAADEGALYKDSVDITTDPPDKRGVAYVTQEHTPYPHLTVFENIAFPLRQSGAPVEEIRRRVNAIAHDLDISPLLSRKPRVLSKGQQQVLALARAIVKRPDVILLDEPFASLDPLRRTHIKTRLRDMQRRGGLTVVIVTHDDDDASELADVIVTMDNGSVTGTHRRQNT
jgi:ABC-type sugar transport system ATPase subunit